MAGAFIVPGQLLIIAEVVVMEVVVGGNGEGEMILRLPVAVIQLKNIPPKINE